MKLNYKRTIFVGFAFFLICLFWQAYDTLIPKILTDKFGMSQTWSGVIMALDNILALFMLPLFGHLSDRTKSRFGRRTPFIVIGTVLACVMFVALSFGDNMQLTKLKGVTEVDKASLTTIFEAEQGKILKTPDGKTYVLSDNDTADYAADTVVKSGDFTNITLEDKGYTDYVVPARQDYAWTKTVESPVTLIYFIVVLLLLLIAMATFRTPAVALMPDVTIKPLRSKGNAIINLMGTFGGIIVLVLGMVFGTGKAKNALMSYIPFILTAVGLMIVALLIFMIFVREPKFVREAEALAEKYGIDKDEEKVSDDGGETVKIKLTPGEKRSLIFILASVAFWFMGYNAVTSKYSVYAGKVLELDYNMTLMIANGAAIVSYLPVGFIASKIGRKKTIIAGIIMLASSFFAASFLRAGSSIIVMDILFALAGIGWATINVNSFPMVVELAGSGDTGKFTGFYYTASMAAQTITPIISGALLDVQFTLLFPYATVFVVLSLITMLFVKHGDSKPTSTKKGLEKFEEMDV